MSRETNQNPEFSHNQEEFSNQEIENVSFKEEKSKNGKTIYASSEPGRKRIVLAESSQIPIPGLKYKVRIIEDSNPNDPNKGILTAEIIDNPPLKPNEWHKVELNLDLVEEDYIKSRLNRAEIYRETGKAFEERVEDSKRDELPVPPLDIEALIRKTDVEEVLGHKNSYEREFLEFRAKNVREAIRTYNKILSEREKCLDQEVELLKKINRAKRNGRLSRGANIALEEVRTKLTQLTIAEKEIENSSPEGFYSIHLSEMRENKRSLSEGKTIIETPYVKQKIERITSSLRAGIPVMVYGHLGSGKTELAMHIAKNYILPKDSEKSALVISGSKHTSLAELYGHQILAIDKINKDDIKAFASEVETKLEEWEKENQVRLTKLTEEQREKEKDRAHDRLLQTYLSLLKSGTISDYFLGPVYRAMEEGVPVIIDEVNAIPHEVLISLNHILTRKPGDMVNVQQDSGRTVKVADGFCVIMTGNLNTGQDVYVDREDMDPAFLSRLYKTEYDYLPQKTEGGLSDSGAEDELYNLLLIKVMDRQGNLEAPQGTPVQLWTLAKSARVIEDIFSGKEIDGKYYFLQAGGRSADPRTVLRENVLSTRGLSKILDEWTAQNYKYELDFYIWDQYVSQSTNPTERLFLYQLLQTRFGFFQKGSNWPDSTIFTNPNTFSIEPPHNNTYRLVFHTPRQVVEFAYGMPPERKTWPRVPKP